MRTFVMVLVLAAAMMACGSGGGSGGTDVTGVDVAGTDVPTADGTPDVGKDAADDGSTPDGTEPGDGSATDPGTPDPGASDPGSPDPDDADALPPDLSDVQEDAPADTTEVDAGPPLPYSHAFLDRLCGSYCALMAQCSTEPADCVQGCFADVVADPGYAKNLACWTATSTCELFGKCFDAAIPDDPACSTAGQQAEGCGFFPDPTLGADATDFLAQCSGFAWAVAGTDSVAMLQCILDAIAACDASGMAACFPQQSGGTCDDLCASLDGCGNIPGLFASVADCQSACYGWDSGPALAVLACATIGNDEGDTPTPQSCEAQGLCFPPPSAKVEGTDAFCTELLALCSGAPGFDLPDDVGICGWLVTGLTVRLPGADVAAGTTCVQAKADCADPQGVMTCLLPPYEPCTGMCQTVDACLPEPKPADWTGVEACAQWCSMGHAQDPSGAEQIVQCVTLSSDCTTTLACLPN